MPLDEKEKEALKEMYKEHRQEIWSGKHSRKSNRKKDKSDIDNFVSSSEEEKSPRPPLIKGEDKGVIKGKGKGEDAEQPTRSDEIENAEFVEKLKRGGSPKLADYEEQNQMVILRRTKEKKPVNEAPMEQSDIPKSGTEKMPSFSERTTLYEPESTHKTEVKLPSPDVKTTMLDRSKPQSNSSSSSPNVAELSTNLEVTADTTTSSENILKEKIKSQRQEIWTGISSQKKRQPKLKKQKGLPAATYAAQAGTEAEENLGNISEQNSQETKKGLTLGVVIIGIAAVVFAVVLGVLLGYLLA